MKIVCVFFSICRETNSFQKLFTNGSNAYLIDRMKPTTVFVHGFSDSFQSRKNCECEFFFVMLNFLWTESICFYWEICSFNQEISFKGDVFNFIQQIIELKITTDKKIVQCLIVQHSVRLSVKRINFLNHSFQPGTINYLELNHEYWIEMQSHWIGVSYRVVHIGKQPKILYLKLEINCING